MSSQNWLAIPMLEQHQNRAGVDGTDVRLGDQNVFQVVSLKVVDVTNLHGLVTVGTVGAPLESLGELNHLGVWDRVDGLGDLGELGTVREIGGGMHVSQ